MADRYTYFPLIGIFILVAWAGDELIDRWAWLKRPLAVLTLAVLVGCCQLTNAQVRLWESTGILFTHTAAVTKDNAVALTNLGLVAINKQDYAEAHRQLDAALKLEPGEVDAQGNLASLFVAEKNYDAAINVYM